MSSKPELANRAEAREVEPLPQTDDLDPTALFVAIGLFAVLGALAIIPVRGVR